MLRPKGLGHATRPPPPRPPPRFRASLHHKLNAPVNAMTK